MLKKIKIEISKGLYDSLLDRYEKEIGGQAVLGRQDLITTPWLTERNG